MVVQCPMRDLKKAVSNVGITSLSSVFTELAHTEVRHVWGECVCFIISSPIFMIIGRDCCFRIWYWNPTQCRWGESLLFFLFLSIYVCWMDWSWHLWWHLAPYKLNSLETHIMFWKLFFLKHIWIDFCIHFNPSYQLNVVFIKQLFQLMKSVVNGFCKIVIICIFVWYLF